MYLFNVFIIHKLNITMNMYELIELPFTNEIAIEAMLFENLAMLQLGKTLVKPRIIRHEVALLDASGREERINLLIQTEQFSAMVKIVAGEVTEENLKGLKRCLAQKEEVSKRYMPTDAPTEWFGLLIGSRISDSLQESLRQGLTVHKCPVAAILLRQFLTGSTPVLLREVLASTTYKVEINQPIEVLPAIMGSTRKMAEPKKRKEKKEKKRKEKKSSSEKDYTKYSFNGQIYNKGKLVNAVFHKIAADHPELTLSDLENYFPERMQPGQSIFITREKAMQLAQENKPKRHHTKPEQIVKLADAEICTSAQWSKESIPLFIEHVKKLFGYEIKKLER